MKIEINKLAEHFAYIPIQVEGVYRFTQRPGKSWPSHTEPFPGFVFPLNGKVEFAFNDTPYIFTPGKVVHGGAKMKLAGNDSDNTSWEYLLVQYKLFDTEPREFSFSSSHFEMQVGYSARLYDLLDRLWKISFQSGGISAFQTETLFRNVLEEVFISADRQNSMDSQALFWQVTSYIHRHYSDDLSIPMLAEQNGVNKNRLTYVFSKYIGMGPGSYLLEYRLNRAKKLLLESNASVHEIAQVVGFNDPFHFSKAFKNKFGISPSKFRKRFIKTT